MKSSILHFIIIFILGKSAFAEECHFKYWEVVPPSSCKTYFLPDFNFTFMPQASDAPDHIKRFCSRYEVSSKFGKQVANYCYTGEGDNYGPTFKLGDQKWSQLDKNKDNVFFADLHFAGCYNRRKSNGYVFGKYGWLEAPNNIQRSWPLEGKLAKCE